MTLVESVGRFGALSRGRSAWWVVTRAAGVALSGMLEDCATDADLREAWRHFATLRRAGVVSRSKWYELAGRLALVVGVVPGVLGGVPCSDS